MLERSQELIRKMVDNYNSQVDIVGTTDMTLTEYLKGIGISDDEIKYGLGYQIRVMVDRIMVDRIGDKE